MATEVDPIVGNWYQHLDKGQEFQVVAVDEENNIVESQHFDGDIEEITLDEWYQLDIEPIEPPEDWTGPVDDIVKDDLGYPVSDMQPDDWDAPLREIHPDETEADLDGGESEAEEEEEGWSDEQSGVEFEEYRE